MSKGSASVIGLLDFGCGRIRGPGPGIVDPEPIGCEFELDREDGEFAYVLVDPNEPKSESVLFGAELCEPTSEAGAEFDLRADELRPTRKSLAIGPGAGPDPEAG